MEEVVKSHPPAQPDPEAPSTPETAPDESAPPPRGMEPATLADATTDDPAFARQVFERYTRASNPDLASVLDELAALLAPR